MPVGLELYNTAEKLLASTEMLGYFCRKSGTGTTVAATGDGNTVSSRAVAPIGGLGYSYPLVAIQIAGYAVARAGNNFSTGDYHYSTNAPIGTSFSYYVFEYSPNLPSSNIGLEIYNSAGQITFSSLYHPLQVLNLLSSGAVTHTGKSLAIGLGTVGGFRTAGDYDYYNGGSLVVPGDPYDSTGFQNFADLYGGTLSNSNQTVTYDSVSYDNVYIGPGAGDIYKPPDFDNPCVILVADVTNIPSNTTFF
jgi:hypothetical protein